MSIARGTVRAGSFTSPLGTRAASTPANAKIKRTLLRASVDNAGAWTTARLAGSMAKSPPASSTRSGSIFATVIAVFTRAPRSTPRTLIVANTT